MSELDYKSKRPFSPDEILAVLHNGTRVQIAEVYQNAHPGDIEMAFERLSKEERLSILNSLPVDLLAEWSNYLTPSELELFLEKAEKSKQKETLNSLSDDELVDFLQTLDSEAEQNRYLDLLGESKKMVTRELLQYPEESAGGRMTTMIAVVTEGITVKEALDQLRAISQEAELLSRIYVVDEADRLVGRIRLRDLAFASWDTPISRFLIDDEISIQVHADQEEAANMIARYDLMALPVVDGENRLLGLITHDDALEILEEESTEDLELQSGIRGDSDQAYLHTSVINHLKRRLGWVVVLAFLALISGVVLLKYEDVMKSFYILALYFPMVVAAGGNTGAQSATMVIRALALGELGPGQFVRVVWKELRVGAILGAVIGLCVAFQVRFLLPESVTGGVDIADTSLVVGMALTAQIFTSTLIGAILPILARMLRLDPALVASPAITTIVDVSGAIIYFTLARMLLL